MIESTKHRFILNDAGEWLPATQPISLQTNVPVLELTRIGRSRDLGAYIVSDRITPDYAHIRLMRAIGINKGNIFPDFVPGNGEAHRIHPLINLAFEHVVGTVTPPAVPLHDQLEFIEVELAQIIARKKELQKLLRHGVQENFDAGKKKLAQALAYGDEISIGGQAFGLSAVLAMELCLGS